VAVAGPDPDDCDGEQTPSPSPWYNRTPAVVGASLLGVVVIGVLILAVSFVARQSNEPEQAPLNFVEPSFSATATHSSSTPTTTATITSTSPPVTTDIDGPSGTTSSSDTSSSDTSPPRGTAWTSPYTGASTDESAPTTTRRGPRTNVTRTLYPPP
jgi:cytoskeletal protein RodZ